MMIRFVPLLYTICVSFSLFFMPCSCVRNEHLSIERAIITDSIVSLREQGNMLRNESRFDEALEAHSRSLHLAESVADTLETVKALNNIGTDYRRLGILDVAQEYHYTAWILSCEFQDSSYDARKNRVVSLNGLGNIYLSIGNYDHADSLLRMALRGEKELGSFVGMAINYANIGSIFKYNGEMDSARAYYTESMKMNEMAGSDLGISLCHTYFGSLYEIDGNYEKAAEEYTKAYNIMQASKDEWHSLNSLIALAGIFLTVENYPVCMEYLTVARQKAQKIKSPEHLATVCMLLYRYYKETGDCKSALAAYEEASSLKESILDMEKMNRMQNVSMNIEKSRQSRLMLEANNRLERERTARQNGFAILGMGLVVLAFIVAVLLYLARIRHRSLLEVRRMSALRESFFTNITHEFRTPLTLILGISHDMQSMKGVSDSVRSKAGIIESQGKGLLNLINQLLDISRIRSAVGDPSWLSGDLSAFVEMVVDNNRAMAEKLGIVLVFCGADNLECVSYVPDYIAKIVNNLLSNALKFTPEEGRVCVSIRCDDISIFIEVSDTGSGIDSESIPHIFEPFYQSAQARSNGYDGSGVGLALVKEIAGLLGGEVAVDSVPGKGSSFTVKLPLVRAVSKVSEHRPANVGRGGGNKPQILIVEDNKNIADYIAGLFAGSFGVSVASNGEEGFSMALDIVPDLIITDLMMPGTDGFEFCRNVRNNQVIDHIPIIIVTAKIQQKDRMRGFEAGADAFLTKPFDSDELRILVDNQLERHRNLRSKFSGSDFSSVQVAQGQMSEQESHFLAKASDFVLSLMESRRLDVPTLAEKFCMSPRQLHRKIVTLTGAPPSSFILSVRMQRACALMRTYPEWTVEEIADKCGFDHVTSFYHSFKKVYGLTPSEYRRKML
ncbi:MAG: ATP-binding protein [Candidatus Coprenecus sp.]|nr:ATP-binding protein [Candidatus Coprenecus sp.]